MKPERNDPCICGSGKKFQHCCERKALSPPAAPSPAEFNPLLALYDSGRYEELEKGTRSLLGQYPGSAFAWKLLGVALMLQGKESLAAFQKVAELLPDDADAHFVLGDTQKELGLFEEAAASYRRALAINPNFAEAHNSLGTALFPLGLSNDAVASFRRALAIKPDFVEALNNLGNALKDLGIYEEAIASFRRALAIKPDFAEAHYYLGVALNALGLPAENTIASIRRALEIKPNFAEAYGALLFALNYTTGQTPSDYLEKSRLYGQMMASKVTARFTSWQCKAHPERLRVGMVSGDLRAHPVGYFLEGLLAQLDPARIELIAYPTSPEFDQVSARIKPSFAAWKPLVGLNDKAAAQLIHADGVHVLIDLSGNTAHNRLPVFAWKPAPVQLSWIGLPATTGLAEMNYVLGDPIATPAEDEGHFTEKVWRLPESYLCFTPPDAALDAGTLPALKAGCVTFGSFNNLTKMSDETVAVWARVLHAVPGSRLLLKTRQLKSPAVLEATLRRFDAHGIGSDRLILEGFSAPKRMDHLAAYQRVDIALDPFPYRGVTTSVEALWMGVPVITLRGDRFLSRTAESIARNAGLADWIAADEDNYVAKAVFYSENLERLANLRAGLRKQVLPSPLFDTARFARNVEDALWGMWQAHAQRT